MEAITTSNVEALRSHGVSPQIITFLISMIPLLELRGSIIVAGGLLKLPFIQTFIAAVLGGIGSVQGAMIGGLLLGIIEIMIIAFFPELSGYRDAFAFVLLIMILFVKPTGLMGEKLEDKI